MKKQFYFVIYGLSQYYSMLYTEAVSSKAVSRNTDHRWFQKKVGFDKSAFLKVAQSATSGAPIFLILCPKLS